MSARAVGRVGALRARLRGTPVHLAWRYASSALGALRERAELDQVRTYCLFIGHARSGHSIVGALLDAHPQVAISDELDALEYIGAGFTRRQVLYLSVAIARHQAQGERRKAGRGGAVYSYLVPGQWQGRTRNLRVVGDSHAGWTTRRLAAAPVLLTRVERRIAPLELRFIHVVRNPFDNIATMMIRGERTFDSAFGQYFDNCAAIVPLVARIGSDRVLRLRHEEVIGEPPRAIARACAFLDIAADPAYLQACAGILYPSPSRSRSQVEWTDDQLARIREGIERYEFLSGYRFEE